jgi:DNA (cytosine-5)-methyltransferase 1
VIDLKVGRPSPPGQMTFVDLFTGAGGLSLGLFAAGLKGLFAVENEPNAFETLRANLIDGDRYSYAWPGWLPKEPTPIGLFLRRYRTQLLGLRGSVDVLAGGPPCQGFSSAGQRSRKDPRNSMFEAYVEAARLLRPRYLVFENVPWIAIEFGKEARLARDPIHRGRPAKPFSERVAEALRNIGYLVLTLREIASDFGVPQNRKRHVLIGVRDEISAGMDEPDVQSWVADERDRLLIELGLPRHRAVSVREAISDLETAGRQRVACDDFPGFEQIAYHGPRTQYQRVMRPGMPRREAPNSMRLTQHRAATRRRFAEILATCRKGVVITPAERDRLGIGKVALTPLHPDKPSKTITSLPDDLIHYSEPRILTVRESARIQSFPDWFEFRGRYTAGGLQRRHLVPRYTQVANAVPPLLATVIGRVLIRMESHIVQDVAHASREMQAW